MKKYIEKYRGRILLIWIFVFLIHGAKINSDIIGIDTEDLIQYQGDFYNGWLNTGRQGLVFLKHLFGNLSYNPYFAGLLTVLCFAVAVCVLFLLWDSVGRNRRESTVAWFVGGLLLVSHPIITEQFYFTLQSAEICIGIILTVVAVYITRLWEQAVLQEEKMQLTKQLWLPAISIVLLVLTFSVYQVLVVVFIFIAITVILLQGLSDILEDELCGVRKLLLRIVPYVTVFFIAFIVNTVLTNSFFSTSDYLSNQVQWGKTGIGENLKLIGGHIIKTLLGYDGIYYNLGYGILCLTAVVAMVWLLVCTKQKKSKLFTIIFFMAALLVTPYLMTIVLGGTPAYRSQLVLPLATAYMAYLVIEIWIKLCETLEISLVSGILLVGIVVGCVIGCWDQTKTTMLLYYTDHMRYEQDVATGREMIARIDRICGEETVALVVVGSKPFEGNNICVDGEMIGTSFFDHDSNVEPACYWSTKRVQGLLHVLGANYELAPVDRFESSIEYSRYMPSWPAEECVQMYEGVTIVKLSDYE